MSRNVLFSEPFNEDFVIATTQLESKKSSSEYRKAQMIEAFKVLEDSGIQNVILAGDFGFGSRG